MKTQVISLENKKVGDIDLDDAIFGAPVRKDIIARMVNWQLAKRRAGTHKVKGRSEVSATKAKPFNQKGSGRARQGTRVAPQMRGGGVVFGPAVRTHNIKLPKKVRQLALKSALSEKQADGNLIVIDKLELKSGKTKDLNQKFATLGWGSALVIDGADIDVGFARAASNVIGLDFLPSMGANVYDILRRDKLVLTKDAVEKLVERLK
jgi:large subunit ribosomal protein L4